MIDGLSKFLLPRQRDWDYSVYPFGNLYLKQQQFYRQKHDFDFQILPKRLIVFSKLQLTQMDTWVSNSVQLAPIIYWSVGVLIHVVLYTATTQCWTIQQTLREGEIWCLGHNS